MIDEVVVTELQEGGGTVRCRHGILPPPVLAVTNIVVKADIVPPIMNVRGEFATSTGIVFVAVVA